MATPSAITKECLEYFNEGCNGTPVEEPARAWLEGWCLDWATEHRIEDHWDDQGVLLRRRFREIGGAATEIARGNGSAAIDELELRMAAARVIGRSRSRLCPTPPYP
jgi:hypothetical protein